MSILQSLKAVCDAKRLPVMTGSYVPPQGEAAPTTYIVLTPMDDELTVYGDDMPHLEIQSARLTLFSKSNYLSLRNTLRDAILAAGLTITDMRFIEHEPDTGYYHYAIDVESIQSMEG